MNLHLVQLFCNIDDFVNELRKINHSNLIISNGKVKRGTPPLMSLSELMTIIVMYHSSGHSFW